MSTWLQNILKDRKQRRNARAYTALITTPGTGAVTLPAGIRIALKSVSGCIAGTTAATLAGTSNHTIKTPLLDVGGKVVVDFVERGTVVTPSVGFDLMIDKGLGRFVKIGEGA